MKPGEVFAQGKYTLLRKLRASGMAEVWLARQHGTEGFAKDVVIKRILPHLAEDEKLVTMFLDEARIAANLNHPNVVQIFDLGNNGRDYFIAMEYIRGYDIEQIQEQLKLRHLSFPAEIASKIIADTCLGLAYAHDCKTAEGTPMQVVHRDVSPQNILVSETGVVKLIDFGIAKARTSSTRTQVGHTKGKICYMSPEQMMARELDRRSDIFSAGVVLYEMLCSHKPFDGDNLLACFHKLMKEGIPSPRQLRGELAPQLENIVMTALERDREDRYPTATALRYELQKYIDGEGVSLGPEHLADFLKWLFNPDDSTQVMFDLPRQKQKASRSSTPLPVMHGSGPTPPPPPASITAKKFGTEDRLSVPPDRITSGSALARSQPYIAGAPASTPSGSEPGFDDFSFGGPTAGPGGSSPSLSIGHTGPQIGLPLEFDDDHESPYTSRRRKRRKQGGGMGLYLVVFLLLAGAGVGGAYFAGFFGKPASTQPPPRINGTPAKQNIGRLPPMPGTRPDAGTPRTTPKRPKPVVRRRTTPRRPKPAVRRRVKPRPRPRRRRPRPRPPRRRYKCGAGFLILDINKGIKNPKVNINDRGYSNLPILSKKRLGIGRHKLFFMWSGGPGGQRGGFARKYLRIRPCMNKFYCKLEPGRVRCERE